MFSVCCRFFSRTLLLETKSHRSVHKQYFSTNCADEVTVNYITKDGKKIAVKAKVGDNAMYLAQRNNIEIEGACEASLACCTCHVYVGHEYLKKLSEPDEREEDMLDMAPFLKPNSRLSCQIIVSKELDGIDLTLPPATRNFYVDGKKPTPH